MNSPALEEDVARAREAIPTERTLRVSPHELTPQEQTIMGLIGEGLSNAEIASRLFISPLTVRTHVKRIHEKTGVAGRARLAVVAAKIA